MLRKGVPEKRIYNVVVASNGRPNKDAHWGCNKKDVSCNFEMLYERGTQGCVARKTFRKPSIVTKQGFSYQEKILILVGVISVEETSIEAVNGELHHR